MPRVAVLTGDGIGPEITAAATRVFSMVRPNIDLVPCLVGGSAIDAGESALPERTLDVCKSSDAIFLGAVGGPKYDRLPLAQRPEGALLQLCRRRSLDCPRAHRRVVFRHAEAHHRQERRPLRD